MPDLFTPIDEQPWPSERFLRQAPTWAPSGVIGVAAASASTGDMALSFSATGGVVTVLMAPGRANCRGMLYERTATSWQTGVTGTQPTPGAAPYALNSNSQPRIDRLVLRRDPAAKKVYPLIVVGSPSAAPQKPALTQVEAGIWDVPLFSWLLAGNNSTAVSDIVDERRWVDPAGGPRGHLCRPFAVANPGGGPTKFAGPNNAYYAMATSPRLYVPAGRLVHVAANWQWGNGAALTAVNYRFERLQVSASGAGNYQTPDKAEFVGGGTADSVAPSTLAFRDAIAVEGVYTWSLAAKTDAPIDLVGIFAGTFSEMSIQDDGPVPLL